MINVLGAVHWTVSAAQPVTVLCQELVHAMLGIHYHGHCHSPQHTHTNGGSRGACFFSLLGKWPQLWPWSCTRAVGGPSPLPSPLECVLRPPSLLPEAAPRVQPWDSNVCETVWTGYVTESRSGFLSMWPNSVKISMLTFNIWSTEIYSSCGRTRQA